MEDWYDHPQYFDMVFRNETAAEVAFFDAGLSIGLPIVPVRRCSSPDVAVVDWSPRWRPAAIT